MTHTRNLTLISHRMLSGQDTKLAIPRLVIWGKTDDPHRFFGSFFIFMLIIFFFIPRLVIWGKTDDPHRFFGIFFI